MTVDFTQYAPPGVYVQETTVPVVLPSGVAATTVALVGPTLGFQAFTETVVLTGTVEQALRQRGIVPGSVTVSRSGVTLVDGADYTLRIDTTLGDGQEVTYIRRIGSSQALTGAGPFTLTVTSRFTPADYYEPQFFEDYDTLVEVYGPPLLTTPQDAGAAQVVSPLSLAAKIAFENGANTLITVPTDDRQGGSFQDQLEVAYDKIATRFDVEVVVPVLFGVDNPAQVTSIGQALAAYCERSTVEGFPRVGVLGLSANFGEQGIGTASADAVIGVARAVKSKRVVLAYPEAVTYFNSQNNQDIVLDGFYLAAAYAGRLVNIPVQKPLTQETISSFSGLPTAVSRKQTRTFMDSLSQNGVAVTQVTSQGVMKVRHGVSTDMDATVTREVSITRARDVLYISLQNALANSSLIGSPITTETGPTVKGVVAGILENAVSNGNIVAYQNLKVRQQALLNGDPTVIEVKFEYRPSVPLNYIVVSFSIDSSSGSISNLT